MTRGAAIALPLLLFLAHDAAAEPAARFHYVRGEGAETCADEGSMRRAVAAQLGYDPFKDDATTAVHATVNKKGEKLVGRVEVRRPGQAPGLRELSSRDADCASLGSAMALTISIAIDPLAITRPHPELAPLPPPATPPSEPVEAAPAARAPDVPAPVDAESRSGTSREAKGERPKVVVGLSNHGTLGVAPSPAFGVGALLALRWSRLSIGVEGRIDLPARADLSTGGEVKTWTGTGAIVPCVHAGMALFCGMAAVGSMQGESTGVSTPGNDHGLYAAVGARAGLDLALTHRIALRPEIDAWAAVARPSLELNGRTIWTMPPMSVSLGLVLVMQF